MTAPGRNLHTPEIHFLVVDWRQGFEIGVSEVDAEHQHLFALVKALCVETAEETMRQLLDYIVTHFAHEQELMEASRFPDLQQHLQLHEQFSMHVADFLSDESSWDEIRVGKLRKFLNKWLVGHILTHDLRFGRWYQAQAAMRATPPTPQAPWWAKLLGRS